MNLFFTQLPSIRTLNALFVLLVHVVLFHLEVAQLMFRSGAIG